MSISSDANSSSTSVGELTERLEVEGYSGQFGVVDANEIRCFTCRATHMATELVVDQMVRTEGVSDPDDEAAVAAVTCPSCEAHGTLVLRYGPASDPDDGEVLRLL